MSTQKQIDANRLNAQKSTGPKTPGDKYNSSQNAITHGLFAKSLLLPGESADRFNALMTSYINHFNPTSPDEFDLVETMAANRWRLRRTWTLETVSLTQEQEAQSAATRGEDPPVKTVLAHRNLTNPPRSLESLSRQEMRCDLQYYKALDRLNRLRLGTDGLAVCQSENEKSSKRPWEVIESKNTTTSTQPGEKPKENPTNPEENPRAA